MWLMLCARKICDVVVPSLLLDASITVLSDDRKRLAAYVCDIYRRLCVCVCLSTQIVCMLINL